MITFVQTIYVSLEIWDSYIVHLIPNGEIIHDFFFIHVKSDNNLECK